MNPYAVQAGLISMQPKPINYYVLTVRKLILHQNTPIMEKATLSEVVIVKWKKGKIKRGNENYWKSREEESSAAPYSTR